MCLLNWSTFSPFPSCHYHMLSHLKLEACKLYKVDVFFQLKSHIAHHTLQCPIFLLRNTQMALKKFLMHVT